MKKKFNIRLFYILAVSLICVSAFSVELFVSIKLKTFLLLFLILSLFVFVILIVKLKKIKLIYICFVIFCCILSVFNVIVRQSILESKYISNESKVLISGRICSNYSYTSTENLRIELDNITITDSEKCEKIKGKICCYIDPDNIDLSKINIGRFVEIFSEINFYNFSNSTDMQNVSKNICGYVYCFSTEIELKDEIKIHLNEKIKSALYNKLEKSGIKYYQIAFAMLFGDTTYIEKDVKSIFSDSGIAHLLAVSGLHISILAGIINSIFYKLKVNKNSRLIGNCIFFAFYCYLCNFSVSIVRASIMTILSLFAKNKGLAYDGLSSLSFASIIVLLINPLMIKNYSFILSFSCVFIIVLFQKCCKYYFDFIFYKNFSDTLSLCLSVQLGLLFIQLFLFGKFNLLSIFSNLILVPMATISFEIMIISIFLTIILPFLSFLYNIFDIIMSVVVQFGNYIASLNFNISLQNNSILSIFIYFLMLFVISDYCFSSKKEKSLIELLLLIIGIIIII